MHYHITYHPEQNYRYPRHRVTRRAVGWLVAVLLFLMAIPGIPRIRAYVREYRELYDFGIIAQHLRQGDSLGDSVTAFCTNVLEHADCS